MSPATRTMKEAERPTRLPPETQEREPDRESETRPQPQPQREERAGRLRGRIAIITGGDRGIGRAVAVAFAQEGADVVISYLDEHEDARETAKCVEAAGRGCLLVSGDVGIESHCVGIVAQTLERFGRVDTLVNNATEQHEEKDLLRMSTAQVERTFRTNIYSCFFMVKASLPHLLPGSSIVNTSSVTAYRGCAHLLDDASTKGAIVAFTRSLARAVAERQIRVNAVAPGPVWTPLIAGSLPPDQVAEFGKDVLLGRPGRPEEIAPSYVFLASEDASYMTGQVLHPNGGEIVNG